MTHRPRAARVVARALVSVLVGSVLLVATAGAQSAGSNQLVSSRPRSSSAVTATPASLAGVVVAEGSRDALVRDALLLDFAGYHIAADGVVSHLRTRHPDDPLSALIDVEHRFWPQLYDVGPSRDDPRLVEAIELALDLAKKNYEANRDDPDARALYGRAMMHDARRLALDGYMMRAGSRSEDARGMLESVMKMTPDDEDARYLLGNYYYWAGVLPAYLKYVNWLWFVPQGDKDTGLEILRQVSEGPGLYAESAHVMLSVISSHHAPTNYDDAASRLQPLHERYPMNVLIHHELVDVLFKMGRYDDLAPLIDSMAARSNEPQPVRAYARVADLWRARVALHRGDPDQAAQFIGALGLHADELPNWADSWIEVLNAQILDLRGRRDEAVVLYEKAIAHEGDGASSRARRMARAGLEAPFDPEKFEHPLLLTGD